MHHPPRFLPGTYSVSSPEICAPLLLHRFCNGMLMFSPGIRVYQSGPLLPLSRRIFMFVVIRRNLLLDCESRHLPKGGKNF